MPSRNRFRTITPSAKTRTMRTRCPRCSAISRKTLAEPARLDSDIFAALQELFRVHRDAKRKVRLLGVALSGLTHGGEQLDLLEAERRAKLEKLTSAADRLRDRFGFAKLQFGGSLSQDGLRQSGYQSGRDREDS